MQREDGGNGYSHADSLSSSNVDLITDRNKRFTVEFLQGSHMIPNEKPELVGKLILLLFLSSIEKKMERYANEWMIFIANHIIKIVDRLLGETVPSKL